jgi:ABC-type amino acid transport substrate-binding protein
MIRRFAVVVAAVAVIATVSACSSGGAAPATSDTATGGPVDYGLTTPGTITAATTAGGAPFASVDGTGKPVGMLIELNNRIAKGMGLKTVYKTTDTPAGLGGLTSGTYDMMAVGLVESPERAESVAFTKPIFWGQNAVLVRADSKVKTLDDLDGLRVGAGTGSQQYDFAVKSLPKAQLVTEATSAGGVSQLLNGNLDAFLIGATHTSVIIPENPGKLKVALAVDQDVPGGMAINKKLTVFQKAYQAELTKMVKNGTLIDLYYKYFDTKTVPYPASMYKIWPELKQQVAAKEGK